MSNVIGIKGAAQDPDHVLEEAKGDFDSVLIIGWDKDEVIDIRASLNLDHANCLYLAAMFKKKLLNGDYGDAD